ncbi:hypothetical protein E3Q19_03499 [Wallemia mellicola]|nr:hypothetical protein E3Q19_03499 [Wallemia mellicola]TIC25412.1 hypothetical protein E3Q11_03383 [Wallemia mellicola]TIC72994.1 hypothetical protein E3Q00_03388 [Wallemia mellicola]
MTVTHKRPQKQQETAKAPDYQPGIRFHCDACARDITQSVRMRCAESSTCDEVDLCPPCFLEGKSIGKHKPWHPYRVIEQHSYPIFTDDWGADEELLLLEGCQLYGLGNWLDVSGHIGSRSKEEVAEHYHSVYLASDDCMPPLDADIKIDPDTFQARKKARFEELGNKPVEIPPPKTKPLTSAPTNHEVGGYMPGRLEFEHELENDAEVLIKDLEFGLVHGLKGDSLPDPRRPGTSSVKLENGDQVSIHDLPPSAAEETLEDEPQADLQLKLALMDIYNSRVDKRLLGKRLIFDRGLLQHKKIQAIERKRPRDERDLVNKLKPFARLQSAQEHERFVDGLVYEMTLRKRINELQEYRRMGVTTFADAEMYEKDKAARAAFKPIPGREQLLQSTNSTNNGRRDSKKGEEFSRESTPSIRTIKKTPASLAVAQSLYLLNEDEQKLCQSMAASRLASIFGTEQDRVNCSFYYKIGACRHGERCSRKHIKPQFSQTIVMPNVYQNPMHRPDNKLDQRGIQVDFDMFFEDLFMELCKFGNLLEMHVCDNVGDHLIGNVYARYEWETEAQAAVDKLNERWYAGRPLHCELSPVTDFREACCRQNDTGDCNRGGFCNFMHLKRPTRSLIRDLQHSQRLERKLRAHEQEDRDRPTNGRHSERSRSRSPRR